MSRSKSDIGPFFNSRSNSGSTVRVAVRALSRRSANTCSPVTSHGSAASVRRFFFFRVRRSGPRRPIRNGTAAVHELHELVELVELAPGGGNWSGTLGPRPCNRSRPSRRASLPRSVPAGPTQTLVAPR
jgi:hypothetical protein